MFDMTKPTRRRVKPPKARPSPPRGERARLRIPRAAKPAKTGSDLHTRLKPPVDDDGMNALRGFLAVAAKTDASLYDRVAAARSPRRTRGMTAATRSGDATTYVVLAVAAALVDAASAAPLLATSVAAALASAVGWALKRSIARPRPTTRAEARSALLDHPDAYSFPSGHTASAFAAATTIGVAFGPLAATAALAWAILVGVSRVYVGAHYPLDVACGAILGSGVAAFAAPAIFSAVALLA
jgi:undecaprenyl-diphosphatase